MKRIMWFIIAAAVGASAGTFAQETGDPSEDYVLQQARDKYSDGTDAANPENPSTSTTVLNFGGVTVIIAASDNEDRDGSYPYTPTVFSFTPGLSIPFGIWDTSLAVGAIGSMAGTVHGFQGSGVFNLALGDIDGFQGAGVFNIADGTVFGGQGAGVFNIASDVRGIQGAGVFNIADEVSLGQAAGVFNIAGDIRGFQAAGVFNIADSVDGIMAAGVFNIADNASGVMIGLVNVADSLDGVAIGLVNLIGNGINDVALDYQFDTDTTYLTYRSGTPDMYAVFYAGQPAESAFRDLDGLTVGSGIGHRFRFLFLTADIEVCAELPFDTDVMQAVEDARWNHPESLPWDRLFGSVRASFGMGRRRGFGAYLGIKTDFSVAGSDLVPERLRSSYGSPAPRTIELFGEYFELWPKLFLGFKF